MALALGPIGLVLCCSGVQLREESCIRGRLWKGQNRWKKDRCEEMPKHVCIAATCASQAFLNIFFMSNTYRLYHKSTIVLVLWDECRTLVNDSQKSLFSVTRQSIKSKIKHRKMNFDYYCLFSWSLSEELLHVMIRLWFWFDVLFSKSIVLSRLHCHFQKTNNKN